jgi:hypothetical protein
MHLNALKKMHQILHFFWVDSLRKTFFAYFCLLSQNIVIFDNTLTLNSCSKSGLQSEE